MPTLTRSMYAAILGCVALLITYFSMPTYSTNPQGIVLSADGPRSPFQGDVQLFSPYQAPDSAERLGFISVQYHNVQPSQESEDTLVNKAKELSQQAGGNGLIFSVGHTSSHTPSAMAMLVLQGIVIKTAG